MLVIEPNRLNDAVGVDRGGEGQGDKKRALAKRDSEGRSGERRANEGRDGKLPGRGRTAEKQDSTLPGRGAGCPRAQRVSGIWKGLEIRIEPYSVLLMPPEVHEPERMRWRAVAYIAPGLDDFIVGFVFAAVDPRGRLRIQADANRVRLEGRPLFTEYRESAFGSRGWLVSLYAALAAGLLLLGVAWRFLAGRTA